MNVSAEKIVEEPSVIVANNTVITGTAPPPAPSWPRYTAPTAVSGSDRRSGAAGSDTSSGDTPAEPAAAAARTRPRQEEEGRPDFRRRVAHFLWLACWACCSWVPASVFALLGGLKDKALRIEAEYGLLPGLVPVLCPFLVSRWEPRKQVAGEYCVHLTSGAKQRAPMVLIIDLVRLIEKRLSKGRKL